MKRGRSNKRNKYIKKSIDMLVVSGLDGCVELGFLNVNRNSI